MAPHPQSPYSVSIERLVGDKWEAVPAELKDGNFSLKLPNKCRFRVVYHNSSQFDAWARTTLDGVNRFAFALEPRFRNAVDIVPPNDQSPRSCFYKDQEGGEGFEIGQAFANAKMNAPPDAIGTIVVNFGAAWEKGKPKPPGEPESVRSLPPPGVNLGPPVAEAVREVIRDIGKVRATVRIHYEVVMQ